MVRKKSQNIYKSEIVPGSVPYFWTSGRKCNFGGCDKPEFFPKLVNGWFWSANQVKMPPTNGNQFHDWSSTGGAGRPQPDNREQVQQGGEEEACMAVLNNFYGDGRNKGLLVDLF